MNLAVQFFKQGLSLFRGGAGKQAAKAVGKLAEKAPKPATLWMTDPNTGILRMERDIIRKLTGQVAKATTQVEQLGAGKVKITTRIDGGGENWVERVKIITTEEAASVFGGKRITIDKNKVKYWCHSEGSKMVKEYSPTRGLEHIDYHMSHDSGNGLLAYKKAGTFDRVYDNYPVSHSAKEMLRKPEEFQYVKHSLEGQDNYYRFADGKSTNYSRAVEAQKQAVIDAAKKAEQEAIAAKQAAEKAAAELAAKRPRFNTGKVLGVNVEDLKVVEKALPDGGVRRYYFVKGNNMPVIKTYDKGLLHQELIYNGKQDVIYMKQVGQGEPYIYARCGNHTQTHSQIERIKHSQVTGEPFVAERYINNTQLYYDGDGTALVRDAYKGYGTRGRVKVFDKNAAKVRTENPVIARLHPDYPQYGIWDNRVGVNAYRQGGYTDVEILANNKADRIAKEMDETLLDFEDLLGPYKK